MVTDDRDLEGLIGKAVADPDFWEVLLNDPIKAIDEAGIVLSPEQRAQFADYNHEQLQKLAEEVDRRVSLSLSSLSPYDMSCHSHSSGW